MCSICVACNTKELIILYNKIHIHSKYWKEFNKLQIIIDYKAIDCQHLEIHCELFIQNLETKCFTLSCMFFMIIDVA